MMSDDSPHFRCFGPKSKRMGSLEPLAESEWTIRASSPYETLDPTLPIVRYWAEHSALIKLTDFGDDALKYHWVVSRCFVRWVERSRGNCDRCGIVLTSMDWDRDMRRSWQDEINTYLIEHDKDWRIRQVIKVRRFPIDTFVVFETLGIMDLISGTI